LVAGVQAAAAEAIREAVSAVAAKHVRAEHELDVPVRIPPVEELDFKIPVLSNVLLLDENRTLVLHVSRRATVVLLVVVVVLDGEARSRKDPVATGGEFFGVVRRPDLDLLDIGRGETGCAELVVKVGVPKQKVRL